MNKEEIKPLSLKCINILSLVMGDALNKYKLFLTLYSLFVTSFFCPIKCLKSIIGNYFLFI